MYIFLRSFFFELSFYLLPINQKWKNRKKRNVDGILSNGCNNNFKTEISIYTHFFCMQNSNRGFFFFSYQLMFCIIFFLPHFGELAAFLIEIIEYFSLFKLQWIANFNTWWKYPLVFVEMCFRTLQADIIMLLKYFHSQFFYVYIILVLKS